MNKVDINELPILNEEKQYLNNIKNKLEANIYLIKDISDIKLELKEPVFIGININDDHVNELILYSQRMDSMPSQLDGLRFLTKLRINGFQFQRNDSPSLINDVKDLEYLDLSYNYFRKNRYSTDIIFNLNKLRYLDLSNCIFEQNLIFKRSLSELISLKLNSIRINNYPESIRILSNLEYLDLSNNPELQIQDTIYKFSKLKKLNIAYCKLNVDSINFDDLIHLEDLNISSLGLSKIPDSIKNLIGLKSLDISHNDIRVIPSFIYSLSNLMYLDLSDNKISSLSNDISNLKNLKHINLNFNVITILPDNFSNLKDLNSCGLVNNQLRVLPKDFNQLDKLESLYLTNNKLEQFPQNIKELKNLNKLFISDNPINDFYEVYNLNLKIDKKIMIKDVFFSNMSVEQAGIKLVFEFSDELLYNYIESMKNIYPKLRFAKLEHFKLVYNNKATFWKTFFKNLYVKLRINDNKTVIVEQFGFQIENEFINLISYQKDFRDHNSEITISSIPWTNLNFKLNNEFLHIIRDQLNRISTKVFQIDSKEEVRNYSYFSHHFFFDALILPFSQIDNLI